MITAHSILPRVQTLRELQAYKSSRQEKSVSDLHAKQVKLGICPKPLPPARYYYVLKAYPTKILGRVSACCHYLHGAGAKQQALGTGTSSCGRNDDPCCIAAFYVLPVTTSVTIKRLFRKTSALDPPLKGVLEHLEPPLDPPLQTSSLLYCTHSYKLRDLSPFLFTPSLYAPILNQQDFSFTCTFYL